MLRCPTTRSPLAPRVPQHDKNQSRDMSGYLVMLGRAPWRQCPSARHVCTRCAPTGEPAPRRSGGNALSYWLSSRFNYLPATAIDIPLRCYTYPHVPRNAIYGGTKGIKGEIGKRLHTSSGLMTARCLEAPITPRAVPLWQGNRGIARLWPAGHGPGPATGGESKAFLAEGSPVRGVIVQWPSNIAAWSRQAPQ